MCKERKRKNLTHCKFQPFCRSGIHWTPDLLTGSVSSFSCGSNFPYVDRTLMQSFLRASVANSALLKLKWGVWFRNIPHKFVNLDTIAGINYFPDRMLAMQGRQGKMGFNRSQRRRLIVKLCNSLTGNLNLAARFGILLKQFSSLQNALSKPASADWPKKSVSRLQSEDFGSHGHTIKRTARHTSFGRVTSRSQTFFYCQLNFLTG